MNLPSVVRFTWSAIRSWTDFLKWKCVRISQHLFAFAGSAVIILSEMSSCDIVGKRARHASCSRATAIRAFVLGVTMSATKFYIDWENDTVRWGKPVLKIVITENCQNQKVILKRMRETYR
jgi:hypothetical protein